MFTFPRAQMKTGISKSRRKTTKMKWAKSKSKPTIQSATHIGRTGQHFKLYCHVTFKNCKLLWEITMKQQNHMERLNPVEKTLKESNKVTQLKVPFMIEVTTCIWNASLRIGNGQLTMHTSLASLQNASVPELQIQAVQKISETDLQLKRFHGAFQNTLFRWKVPSKFGDWTLPLSW